MTRLAQTGEFGLIALLNQRLTLRSGVRVGIGDDAALLESLAMPFVTTDALVEDVHFKRSWTLPRQLGHKAMAVNISDLAAMGAYPVAAFLCLALPGDLDVEWVQELYAGLEDAGQKFKFTVAGGDTVKTTGPIVLSVTLIGEAIDRSRGAVLRSGALPGDQLFVTGHLGDAAAGLHILQQGPANGKDAEYLVQRQLEPTARTKVMKAALSLSPFGVHAALDISDGLAGDARHLANRSGCALNLQAELLPVSHPCRNYAARRGLAALPWALAGGEDYELLLAVAPEGAPDFAREVARQSSVRLTCIGSCSEGPTEVTITQNGHLIEQVAAFTHF